MMSNTPPKLAFVLSEYGVHTHFRYVGEFAVALAKEIDIVLVLEKGEAPTDFPKEKVYTQYFQFSPLRFIEMGWILLRLHFRGYRTHYVHYSFVAGYWSALLVKLFGGAMFYWNAGMPWLYHRSFFREWFERTVFRLVDHLLTGADALHEGYANYYGISRERIVTLPNWIDVMHERAKHAEVDRTHVRDSLHVASSRPVLLFVHRLAERKGAHLLPEILEYLRDLDPVLVIAGDGPLRTPLLREIGEKKLDANVRMLGWVEREKIHELYAIADIFLLPSEEEGFPHVLTEAQSIGLPYVASDVGGVREMTPPEGRESLVPYGDTELFARHVRRLLADPAWARRVAESEMAWVMRYDKAVVLRRFLATLGLAPQVSNVAEEK